MSDLLQEIEEEKAVCIAVFRLMKKPNPSYMDLYGLNAVECAPTPIPLVKLKDGNL